MGYKKINENLDNIHYDIISSLDGLDNDKLWNIAETFYIWDKYIDLQKEYNEILREYNERVENYDVEVENYKKKLVEYEEQIEKFKVKNEIQINNKTFITFRDYYKIKEKKFLEPAPGAHLDKKGYCKIDEYFPFISEEDGLINLMSLMSNRYPSLDYYYIYHNRNGDGLFDINNYKFKPEEDKPKFIIHNGVNNGHAVFNIVINNKVFNFDLRAKLQHDCTSCRSIALKLLKYYSDLYENNNKENFIKIIERDTKYLKSLIGKEINFDIPEHFFNMLQSVSIQDMIINIKEELCENNSCRTESILKILNKKIEILKEKIENKNRLEQLEKLKKELEKLKKKGFPELKISNKESEIKNKKNEIEKINNLEIELKELEKELKEESKIELENELERKLNKKKEDSLELKILNEELKELELEKLKLEGSESTEKIEYKKSENIKNIKIKESEINKKEIDLEKEVLNVKIGVFNYLINKSSNLSVDIENLKNNIEKFKDIQRQYIKNIQQKKELRKTKDTNTKDTNISYLIDRLEHLLILKEIINQNAFIPEDMFEKTVNGNYNIINFSENNYIKYINDFFKKNEYIININMEDFNKKLDNIYRIQGKEKIIELSEQNEYLELNKAIEEFLIKKELDNLSSKIRKNQIKSKKDYENLKKIEQIINVKDNLQKFHNVLKNQEEKLIKIVNSKKFSNILESFEEVQIMEKGK